MSRSPTYRRVITGLAVLAVIAAVMLIGELGGDEPSATAPEPTPSNTPAAAPPSSVSSEEFCAAFNAMAAAHNNHLANDTEASGAELRAATEQLLWLAQGTAMGPPARQGLQEMVDGVLEESTAAPDQVAADAFSAYLEVTCPAGGL